MVPRTLYYKICTSRSKRVKNPCLYYICRYLHTLWKKVFLSLKHSRFKIPCQNPAGFWGAFSFRSDAQPASERTSILQTHRTSTSSTSVFDMKVLKTGTSVCFKLVELSNTVSTSKNTRHSCTLMPHRSTRSTSRPAGLIHVTCQRLNLWC